nr:MAG TPA: DNA polymerase [Caudoviricetes sp.]
MLDFIKIKEKSTKIGLEIYPAFIIKSSFDDLMIRGGDFYAVWNDYTQLWSTDEGVLINLIDSELEQYAKNYETRTGTKPARVCYLWDSDSGSIDRWHKYCQKQLRDNYHPLDETITFANTETTKKNYISKRLKYPLKKGPTDAYDEIIGTLYSDEERHKLEWAIGAIVTGNSKNIQKFIVMYGAPGTGKSTILNIVQDMFDGYYAVFDAKVLGSSSNAFALEAFKANPLIAIQHDGDLSRIEDNTRLNSVVSHEEMTVNEKFKSTYVNRFNSFLFMGTNKPVKITDAKSGLLRRLIDVSPTGNKIPTKRYDILMNQVKFELGAIAYHCKYVYLENPDAYNNYVPTSMMGASNDFYNYVLDSYDIFKRQNSTTLKAAYEMYKAYCDDSNVKYPLSKLLFKEELKNYFATFNERALLDQGERVRNYYEGFKLDKFIYSGDKLEKIPEPILELNCTESLLDEYCADCQAQYGNEDEKPTFKWNNVKTKLRDLDTHKLHYVNLPENHIVIDFDLKDEKGEKSYDRNIKAASKWPRTYAEVSKGGAGIHLHYIYDGDTSALSRIYSDDIEIKVFTANASLRRKLTKCNDIPIATLNSNLPLKEKGDKVINFEGIKSEKGLRKFIIRNLNKEIHNATKPSIDFIYSKLEECYSSGMKYDVTDMRPAIMAFAVNSSHQSDYCLKLVAKMKFKSDEVSIDNQGYSDDELVFYDVEVFPNLFIVNYKRRNTDVVVRLINPTSQDIEQVLKFKLVGFNCRRYDNHIMYARLMGYDNEQLFNLSQRIIGKSANCMFGEAYNLSYTDVYDFCAKKQSLKKWEIELNKKAEDPNSKMDDHVRALCKKIKHHELGLPWDQPVPEELWTKVAEYCDDDVIATQAVFEANQGDFTAREILAELAGGTVNDTTNSLTTKFIFGRNRHPQDQFMYRDLSQPVTELPDDVLAFLKEAKPEMMAEPFDGPLGKSLLPYFPGYKFEFGKSTYRGEEVGEGGEVWASPGMYGRSQTEDIGSQHPNSAIDECIFGPEYTRKFKEILDIRIHIKHGEYDAVRDAFGGKLAKYLNDKSTAKALAQALKIAINSVYGLTAAKFENPFRDPRNKDNIVAKRGALFMIDLRHAVEEQGYKVIHVKTDSIKIANPDDYILNFIVERGKRYGYNFEVEHIFDRICLVNNAVYIAKLADDDPEDPGKWTATGTQFAVPYVFKTLFSKEPIQFNDMCETKNSAVGPIYLDMNESYPDVTAEEKQFKNLESKYKKGELSDTLFENECASLRERIEAGHNYIFVGKVGLFCPIKPGCGGGTLVCKRDDKYSAVTGTKGYRWLESEIVKQNRKEDDIDKSYYNKLVDDAVSTISEFGDIEWFING